MKKPRRHEDTKINIQFLILRVFVSSCLFLLLAGCAIRKVETSKTLYTQARQAQEDGSDLQAAAYWKALEVQATREIEARHYLMTNYFLRASAFFELGQWERGFEDLKQIQPELLRREEFWIYPLYAVLMGDYYSKNHMTSVAQDFYNSVLKKSTWKSSPIYLLALERRVNNSIQAIESAAEKQEDAEKFKQKEYEALEKDLAKYVEDSPFSGVSHFLLADLLLKLGQAEEALEHFLASLELGLPTTDLQRSTEFEIASLLSRYEIRAPLKSALLSRAVHWWGSPENGSILQSGENSLEWVLQQDGAAGSPAEMDPNARIRYLAVSRDGKLRILAWEKI